MTAYSISAICDGSILYSKTIEAQTANDALMIAKAEFIMPWTPRRGAKPTWRIDGQRQATGRQKLRFWRDGVEII